MNVLIVVPRDDREGGVAAVVGHLARYLEAQEHEVHFLHPDFDASGAVERRTSWGFKGVRARLGVPAEIRTPILRRALLPLYLPGVVMQLASMVRRERIDIVNVHYPKDPFVVFAFLRLFIPVPLVVSIHGADLFPKGRARRRYSLAIRALLARADVIVANSQAFRSDFLTRFPQHAEKTVVIHNGVDLAEWGEARRTDPGSRVGPRSILCVAALNEKKAVDVLIRAMALLDDVEPVPEVLLAGDGPLRGELEALARSMGVEDRVRFLGHQPRSEVHRLMTESDLFVLPSRSEPFGIAVAEALASARPVVASAVGGITEIVEDGVSGLLVEPDDPTALATALRTVLEDAQLRERFRQAGPARVASCFTHQHTGSRYEEEFEELLALSSPRSSGWGPTAFSPPRT